jgi:hypothetical protein
MLSTLNTIPLTTTSSILALGAGALISGDVVVQSAFQGGTVAANRGFRMISSPINEVAYVNTSSKNFFRQLYNRFIITCGLAATTPSHGCDFRPPLQPTAQTLQSYLEPGTAGATSFANLNPQSAAVIGRGYYFFFRGDRDPLLSTATANKIYPPFTPPETWTATYIGTINSGNISIGVTRTNNGEPTLHGLNMLGNPYPATLDLQTFLTANSTVIDNFISIMRPNRTGFVTSSGDIVNNFTNNSLLGGANDLGNNVSSIRYIQPGQGFFVRKTTTAGGTVNFTEAQKAIEAGVPSTRRLLGIKDEEVSLLSVTKAAKPAQRKLVRVTLNNNNTQEQTTIVLEPGNDANYSGYDAPYQANAPITISSLTADGEQACINFMPEVNLVKEIKLNIFSATDSNLKLTFDDLTGIADNDMLLRDSYTKTLTKIKSIKDTVTFAVYKDSAASFGENRFALVFYHKNVLPVQENEFNAVVQNKEVLLTWKTLSEQNAKNIIVQRSTDGINFITIDTVNVKGNSNQTIEYSSKDIKPVVGTLYYRLQKNDVDGTFKHSDVKLVVFGLDKENEVVIFPNPVKDQLNVRYKITQTLNILVYDITGKIVTAFNNVNTLNFKTNVSNLAAGVYVLKLSSATTNQVIAISKFVKQ